MSTKPLLSIDIAETGVTQVVSRPTSMSEAVKAAELSAKTAFHIRCLHESIVGDEAPAPQTAAVSEHGFIFVPRGEIDGEWLEFEKVALYVPPAPRDLLDRPASWFVEAVKRADPKHSFWQNAEYLDGGETETAWMIFQSHSHSTKGFLDHSGWVDDERRGTILVSEPYTLGPDEIEDLQSFCQNAGLEYRIVGFSNRTPARSIRIEIWKS